MHNNRLSYGTIASESRGSSRSSGGGRTNSRGASRGGGSGSSAYRSEGSGSGYGGYKYNNSRSRTTQATTTSASFFSSSSSESPPPPMRRMSASKWTAVHAQVRDTLTPDILEHGFPPDPLATDSYADQWKKLILIEFHALLQDFRKDVAHIDDDLAHVQFDLFRGPNGNCEFGVLISSEEKSSDGGGRVLWSAKEDHAISTEEVVFSLFKVASGWLYITKLVAEDGKMTKSTTATTTKSLPVKAVAIAYDEKFQRQPLLSMAKSLGRGIPVESFSTLIYRFESLSRFESATHPGIQRIIESGDLGAAAAAAITNPADPARATLTPAPPAHRSSSPLNETQFGILSKIQAPVDFVQGPPGTGKSTFIVEFVKTRLPLANGERVLICTTTNKAIDSLTEKLANNGCGDAMLAVGNASRLGTASTAFLLDNRVDRHETVQAFENDEFAGSTAHTALFTRLAKVNAQLQLCREYLDPTTALSSRSSSNGQMKERAESFLLKLQLKGCKKFWPLVLAVESCTHVVRQHTLIKPTIVEKMETARLAMQQAAISVAGGWEGLLDAMNRYVATVNDAKRSIRMAVREWVIRSAKYFVCTAATAATIPDRLKRELAKSGMASNSERETGRGGQGLESKMAKLAMSSTTDEEKPASDSSLFTFDYVILDEAGAMLEPDVIGTVIHGCRFLLCVGDHRQLPPFTKWQQAQVYGYNVSLLSRLASSPSSSSASSSSSSHNMMTTQYRMHPHLAAIVSSVFYDHALTTALVTSQTRSRHRPVEFLHVYGHEKRCELSFLNQEEISVVVELVRREREAYPSQTINVICFHKPQCTEMRTALIQRQLMVATTTTKTTQTTATPLLVDVCTVDSMQGREADVVILSCVRTGSSLGFVSNRNRINVALSRAKQKLYIVGNRTTLCANETWRDVVTHLHTVASTM